MVANYCFHTFGETIADFDAVFVEDLVEAVVLRKMLIKYILKIYSDFCEYIFTEGRIEPDYISFVVTFVVNFCINRVVLYLFFFW